MGHRLGSPSFMNLPGIPYPWVKDVNRLRDLDYHCSNVEISVYDNAITLNYCHFLKGWAHHIIYPRVLSFSFQTSDFRLSNIPNFRDSGSETGQSQ